MANTVCQSCGKQIQKDDDYSYNGYYYCQDCFDQQFVRCQECGEIVPNQQVTQTLSRQQQPLYVCNQCIDQYVVYCDFCGDKLDVYSSWTYYDHDDNPICENCLDRDYGTCDQCNQIYKLSQLEMTQDGKLLCPECKSDQIDPQIDDNSKVYDYPTKLKLKFKKKQKQPQTKQYIGVQLQIIAKYPDGLYYFLKQAKKNKKIIFKKDGSIGSGGIEINTQPATYQYHLSGMGWQRLFSLMHKYDVTDTTNCGIHFHISRNNFSSDQQKVLDYFVNNCASTLGAIGGRDYSNLQSGSYCKKQDKEQYQWGGNKKDRYQAVNFQNENTIQLRFPKTTTSYRQFKRMLSMVHNICKLSKMFTFNEIKIMDQTDLKNIWSQIMKHIN